MCYYYSYSRRNYHLVIIFPAVFFRASRKQYKPIWPWEQHICCIVKDCGLSELLATAGQHNCLENPPEQCNWERCKLSSGLCCQCNGD